MKRVGITQRVEYITKYNETRDCLDQRWSELLLELEYLPIPLPNINPESVSALLKILKLDLIIFSGGNSLTVLDETAANISPQRDLFEKTLFSEAMGLNIPILGVCRGMQMLNIQMGGTLSKVTGHIAVNHTINSLDTSFDFPCDVNSYHSWGIRKSDLSKDLKPLALDSDGNIEAFINEEKKILGIMWHPEREYPFNSKDTQMIKRFL